MVVKLAAIVQVAVVVIVLVVMEGRSLAALINLIATLLK